MPGEMMVTIDLAAVFCGSDVTIVQEGIPDMIPLAACYLGWQDSLTKLARLVEPGIQGGQPPRPFLHIGTGGAENINNRSDPHASSVRNVGKCQIPIGRAD